MIKAIRRLGEKTVSQIQVYLKTYTLILETEHHWN